MKLKFREFNLESKYVFGIAGSSRTSTPVILTEIEHEGITGYGEASMPPYLGESHESAAAFLSKVNIGRFANPFETEDILNYIDSLDKNNNAAKASVDIALHDLTGKLLNKPCFTLWGFSSSNTPHTSFTIGIDSPDVIQKKVKEARAYKILKVKLGSRDDKEIIKTIRSVSDQRLSADVNQGWKDKNFTLDMISWLSEQNVEFIEQPMPKEQVDDLAWVKERSPLPVIADEAVKRIPDIIRAKDVYHGINIKLMKCTGMREAHKMILLARSLGLKVLIGCMMETSCAVSAAAQLSPAADWADLDGNLLISNDPFKGVEIVNGKIELNNYPGIGLKEKLI